MRYISHEIRTPLNSAFLGLSLLEDELKNCVTPEDDVRYEYLCDVQLSCTTALDTLNDLLTFEKLESGILELHKQDQNAVSFISECVRMFSSQAKARSVQLEIRRLIPSPASPATMSDVADIIPTNVLNVANDNYQAVPLEVYDMVNVDKFKMAQVIRNLISNALKFTPPGGSVTVVPSYIPNVEIISPAPVQSAGRPKKTNPFKLFGQKGP